MHTYTCDSLAKNRYYVRAKGTLKGKKLIIDWDYYNDDTRPQVDYTFDVTCEFAKDTTPHFPPITTQLPTLEFPVHEELLNDNLMTPEPFAEDLPIEQSQQTLITRIRSWLHSIFF